MNESWFLDFFFYVVWFSTLFTWDRMVLFFLMWYCLYHLPTPSLCIIFFLQISWLIPRSFAFKIMSLGTPTRLHKARACRVRSNYNYSQSISLIFSFISRPDGVSYPDTMCKPSSLCNHRPTTSIIQVTWRAFVRSIQFDGFHSGLGTERWKREIRPLPCWFFIIIFLGLKIFFVCVKLCLRWL